MELDRIYIDEYTVRRRGGGSLKKWYESIDGVMTYRSFAAEAKKDGGWHQCIASARISDIDHCKIEAILIFSDGTMVKATEHRKSILPDEYMQDNSKQRRIRKKKARSSIAASQK